MYSKRINNSRNGNPRFLIECPIELSRQDMKKIFNCKEAASSQKDYIEHETQPTIILDMVVSAYNIKDFIKCVNQYISNNN